MTDQSPRPERHGVRRLFTRTSWPEARFLADVLRTETVGGALLLFGAVIALVWANSPWGGAYAELGRWVPWSGGSALHLDLDLATWAADGLLAIFFFVVGLELKREFVAGELRDPRRAVLPVVAAVGGMAAPALIYVGVNLAAGGEGLRGWAIPTATDIAFALAVLAVIGAYLPQGLRAFLLTLAVVDDLLAITIIAIFYTDDFNLFPLLGAIVPIALFGLLVQRRRTWWWALIPLAAVAWTLMHASGVHATVAGVLLGFTVPVLAGRPRDGRPAPGLAEHLEHRWRPISAGFAVPIFAFFAAGVSLRGADLGAVATDPIVLGIVLGLVVGKCVGILGSTYLLARFTRARLDEDIAWSDLLGVSLLAGIGFTVSLLIGELAFGSAGEGGNVKAAVLTGSLISALLATLVLSRRNRAYRAIALKEQVDLDQDGVPDVYQKPGG
ncbi:Na+/H+ antiporter NhaA [Micromonospora endophytica]|uniref:Na(+)/H(+) antiporter NhaA n=1 Tax=Micromonospora endophytica TaxID=515350 RepID=A0A2W2CQ23_9ACTN|nr:Na+/H+ antiporter NhaA [Micromonospora endophytica]PZF90469.1 Na+/H+ antiporter NhaA [Micromonospora endophytica]RIW48271.1 Na+/H+ antiporter NhaA [Micromonospora endophytica]BCJ56665.1 Na(+)/H(+) antiporter NhaA [Micromonospora endophytica]